MTSPPLPTRRSTSSGNVAPIEPPKRTHKRQPSIPLVSPDLPPIAAKQDQSSIQSPPEQHPARPSRPIPTPGAPPRPEGSNEHRTSVPNMAKPPKVS